MSIHNDDRRYGTPEEREEWQAELKREYARQEAYDKYCDELKECDYEDRDED